MKDNSYPNSWRIVRLADICEIIMGQSPPSSTYNDKKIGLPFFQGKLDFGEIYPIPRVWCSNPKKIADVGDILLSVRAPVGPTNICNEKCCIGRGLAAVRYFYRNENKFIFYFFRSIENQIPKIGTGSTFSAISKSKIENLSIPFPPLPEQHRIVAKIEELFTKLDAGVEALKKAKEQIKRYRQAVLKYAFEGKLTEEWRKNFELLMLNGELKETQSSKLDTQHSKLNTQNSTFKTDNSAFNPQNSKLTTQNYEPASVLIERIKEERKKKLGRKYKELPPMDTSELPELPEGWVWTRIGAISDIIMGQSPPSSTYNDRRIGLPFYQGKLDFGEINPSPRVWCSRPKKIAEKGDILLSIRAPVGPTNICNEKCCIGRGLAAVRYFSRNENKFIFYFFRSIENQISRIGTGSTFSAISKSQVENLSIPLPPLPEQHRIVEEIERRLSIADATEKTIDQCLKQAERLRQSILKMAFEGKLVPQDPNDEPAEKLLERVRKSLQL
jgi:type I restriction enzyme S subunit